MRLNIIILITFISFNTLFSQNTKVEGYKFDQLSEEIFDKEENYIKNIKNLDSSSFWELINKFYGVIGRDSFFSKLNRRQIVYTGDNNANFFVYEWVKSIFSSDKGKIRIYFFNLISGPYSFVKDNKLGRQLIPSYLKTSKLNKYPQFNFNSYVGEKYKIEFNNTTAYFLEYDLDTKKTKINYLKKNLNPLSKIKTKQAEDPQFKYTLRKVFKKEIIKKWLPLSPPTNLTIAEKELWRKEVTGRNNVRGHGYNLEQLMTIEKEKFLGNKIKLLNSRGYTIFNKFFTRFKIIPTEDNKFNYAIYSLSDDYLNPKYGILKFNIQKVIFNKVVLVKDIYDNITINDNVFSATKNGVKTNFDINGLIIN